jgi:hypothetical protein
MSLADQARLNRIKALYILKAKTRGREQRRKG